MWKKYFGPLATIVGIDILPECSQYEDEQCKVRIGEQGDLKFLNKVVQEFGPPDIVIDDGSHKMEDVSRSFQFLFPLLKNNGIYLVEDTHSCYWESYGGGLGNPSSFIEKAKGMIDTLHAYHYNDGVSVDDITNSVFSINFFDSIIVFEKKQHGPPRRLQTGNPNL